MKTADNTLEIGAILDNRYHVEGLLGVGGFGITYKAHDDTLNCTVVIKEYLPEECSARDSDTISVIPRTNREDDYQYGLEKYLEEAQVLAKFNHPHIVRVTNFIKANGTAYIVMAFEEGQALDEWLKENTAPLTEQAIVDIIEPILIGLAEVHKHKLLHRDIKPGNIFLRAEGGPMLIDFGAARQALGEHSKSISAIISMGYAPPEQYTTRGKQAPYTDLYAVGAVLYKLITGESPVESVDRSHEIHEGEPDPLTPAIEAGKGKVGDWLLQITDQLLNISPKKRPQDVEQVLTAIQNKIAVDIKDTVKPAPAEKVQDNKTRVVRSSDRFSKNASKPKPSNASSSEAKSKTGLIAAAIVAVIAVAGAGWWFTQGGDQVTTATTVKKSATLKKGNAILYVDSKPSDAEVYLDGILLGRTPYNSDTLPKGKHEILLTHANSQDFRESITLNNNVIVKKHFDLLAASGNVSVFSSPAGANIILDGNDTGQTTPATLLNVSVGEHQITLRKDTYYPKEARVSVTKDTAIREDYKLDGGHLIEYRGQWLEPEEKAKRIADTEEAKRIADAKEAKRIADAKKSKRIADANEAGRITDSIGANKEGKKLFAACAGCHGSQGEKKALGKSGIIASMGKAEIIDALTGYKSGSRNKYGMGGLMKGMAARLSASDIENIADYVSGLD